MACPDVQVHYSASFETMSVALRYPDRRLIYTEIRVRKDTWFYSGPSYTASVRKAFARMSADEAKVRLASFCANLVA